MRRSLAIVGGGPRSTGLLERLAANAPELLSGSHLTIHVVEPFDMGAGRVWRSSQSPLLWMNSRANEVTMFTDDSVDCAGPIRPGPTLYEWARDSAEVNVPAASDDFPSRLVAARYLRWCMAQAIAALPSNVDVRSHAATATSLAETETGRQVLTLSNEDCVVADLLVLAQGNIDGGLDPVQANYATFAATSGGAYIPPAYTADVDLSVLPAGEDVIVSGLGLAFIDLMVLLTQGRGGEFGRLDDGTVFYEPSGDEPVLWAGSRRGVPYLPKPRSQLLGPAPDLPQFITSRSAGSQSLWDEICKEMGWGYYHELFTAHPSRTTMRWATFAEEYAELDWCGPLMRDLVAIAVPDPDDRLNMSDTDTPLSERRFATEAELGHWMRDRISRTVRRATDPCHSAEAGAFQALVSVGDQLSALISGPVTSAVGKSLARFTRLAGFMASGPPPYRLEQLAALSAAGIVRFIGSNLVVGPDPERGDFVARTATLDCCVRARYFVEARLPDSHAANGPDRLLKSLIDEGDAVAKGGRLVVDPSTYQVLSADGRHHPGRIALGSFATAGRLGSFSRPASNALFFRQNDMVARQILTALSP